MTIDETVPYLARGFIACVGRRENATANRIAENIEYVVVQIYAHGEWGFDPSASATAGWTTLPS
jgi:hypothetical protein